MHLIANYRSNLIVSSCTCLPGHEAVERAGDEHAGILEQGIQDGDIDHGQEGGHHEAADGNDGRGREALQAYGPFEGNGDHANGGALGCHQDRPGCRGQRQGLHQKDVCLPG